MQSAYLDDDQHHDPASLVPEWQGAVEDQSNAVINDHLASGKPSKASRLLRASGAFLIAVFIGVGATLAWQSYASNATSLRWFSASTKPRSSRCRAISAKYRDFTISVASSNSTTCCSKYSRAGAT
jgi:hypothetical protein